MLGTIVWDDREWPVEGVHLVVKKRSDPRSRMQWSVGE
jgi:hypothetical protein